MLPAENVKGGKIGLKVERKKVHTLLEPGSPSGPLAVNQGQILLRVEDAGRRMG